MKEKVIVLGASPKPDRYANKAQHLLTSYGHQVFPVNPAFGEIDGLTCYKTIEEVPENVDTITLYLGPPRSEPLVESIIAKKPKRVIMNPGTESEVLREKLAAAGIIPQTACTLVLLNTNQYDKEPLPE
ncbi:MAG: CoA-binding protein [Spirochaetia bacterium]|nr:CoA-binding protein [Spirochaetia bacterium]